MNFKTAEQIEGKTVVTLEVIDRDLPFDRQTLKVGYRFHTTPENAEVLILAKRAVEVSMEPAPEKPKGRRRRYKRRDMQAAR